MMWDERCGEKKGRGVSGWKGTVVQSIPKSAPQDPDITCANVNYRGEACLAPIVIRSIADGRGNPAPTTNVKNA